MDVLLFVVLSVVASIGAIYIYIASLSALTNLLKPIFGHAAPGVALIGIPVIFACVTYTVVINLRVSPTVLHFVALFIALLALAVWVIKNDKLH